LIGGRLLACAVVALALVAGAGSPSQAVFLALTEAQKADAIRVGELSVTTENFDTEWRVSDPRGNGAVVMTPFHRLALAARHAAFDGKPLKPEEPDHILKQDADRLLIWVTLRGPSVNFARFLLPTLHVANHAIKAAFVQNERTPARDEDGGYLARCVYGFPTKELPATAQTVLSVADPGGREVARFSIDLARMR